MSPMEAREGKSPVSRTLLVTPPSAIRVYRESRIRAAVAPRPYVSLAMLAAAVLESGHDARILDLQASARPLDELRDAMAAYRPDYLGLTCTTPLFGEARELALFARRRFPDTVILAGGAHPSIMPEAVVRGSEVDIAVFGEGERTLVEIVGGAALPGIDGIAYDDGGTIRSNAPREPVEELDTLPLPAWHLLNVDLYQNPKFMARRNPVGTIESSRGCVYGCVYCNKKTFGRRFRTKSVSRVVDEFTHLAASGFGEVHVWEDMFSTDLQRAKDICDEIVRRRLDICWQIDCGVRVDSVDEELFDKLRDAGCYKVAFGYESGNQQILDRMKKGITLEDSIRATEMAKRAGLETIGFFMLGLPGETEQTMQETIDFAIRLDPDYAKTTLLTLYPGTEIYEEWKAEGRILSEDWDRYNDHTPSRVYEHPTLDWETLDRYYNLFYRRFYLRPGYIARRLRSSLRKGELLSDAWVALKTFR